MVIQSSKPDDHIEGTLDLAMICLWADDFPLNSTLDSIVGVAEPSWLRAYHRLVLRGNNDRCLIQNYSTGAIIKYTMENRYTCTEKASRIYRKQ